MKINVTIFIVTLFASISTFAQLSPRVERYQWCATMMATAVMSNTTNERRLEHFIQKAARFEQRDYSCKSDACYMGTAIMQIRFFSTYLNGGAKSELATSKACVGVEY